MRVRRGYQYCADRTDVKLIENNARIGAQVALELAKLQRESKHEHASSSLYMRATTSAQQPVSPSEPPSTPQRNSEALTQPSVLVFGSAAIDITSTTTVPLSPRSTTPGTIYLSPGGVGRNIAEAAQNLLPNYSVQLVSLIGRAADGEADAVDEPDSFGKVLVAEMQLAGMRTDGLVLTGKGRTAACSLMLEGGGDLVAGVADMEIVEMMSRQVVSAPAERLASADG
jgi:pseudouridine-5'-phosphate glycosidase/pseudouridine kinase